MLGNAGKLHLLRSHGHPRTLRGGAPRADRLDRRAPQRRHPRASWAACDWYGIPRPFQLVTSSSIQRRATRGWPPRPGHSKPSPAETASMFRWSASVYEVLVVDADPSARYSACSARRTYRHSGPNSSRRCARFSITRCNGSQTDCVRSDWRSLNAYSPSYATAVANSFRDILSSYPSFNTARACPPSQTGAPNATKPETGVPNGGEDFSRTVWAVWIPASYSHRGPACAADVRHSRNAQIPPHARRVAGERTRVWRGWPRDSMCGPTSLQRRGFPIVRRVDIWISAPIPPRVAARGGGSRRRGWAGGPGAPPPSGARAIAFPRDRSRAWRARASRHTGPSGTRSFPRPSFPVWDPRRARR